jgi:hypothetical protein
MNPKSFFLKFLAASTMLITVGCATTENQAASGSNQTNALNLIEVKNADPAADLNSAIQRKDFRFVGVMGYVLEVPGLRQDNSFVKFYGIKIVKGTSDAIRSDRDAKLQSRAQNYAAKYNTLLKQYLSGLNPQK